MNLWQIGDKLVNFNNVTFVERANRPGGNGIVRIAFTNGGRLEFSYPTWKNRSVAKLDNDLLLAVDP